ncbi:hypothetical protein LWI29_025829 [Acer saccharum]|uniref:Uncharacterized protein n=1 Tax=Acer saccharum TaxID=4024 RepID=A0AA39T3F0_ACESA|nr:hypothetical protein LWI29_025829 [Acer saccharum]
MLSQEVNQGFNNRGFYQGQGSGSGQANQWNRQENFNNQAMQQQREAVLLDGQRISAMNSAMKSADLDFNRQCCEQCRNSAMNSVPLHCRDECRYNDVTVKLQYAMNNDATVP